MVAIVILVCIVTLFGAAYGIYSRRGSDINAHPRDDEASDRTSSDPGTR